MNVGFRARLRVAFSSTLTVEFLSCLAGNSIPLDAPILEPLAFANSQLEMRRRIL